MLIGTHIKTIFGTSRAITIQIWYAEWSLRVLAYPWWSLKRRCVHCSRSRDSFFLYRKQMTISRKHYEIDTYSFNETLSTMWPNEWRQSPWLEWLWRSLQKSEIFKSHTRENSIDYDMFIQESEEYIAIILDVMSMLKDVSRSLTVTNAAKLLISQKRRECLSFTSQIYSTYVNRALAVFVLLMIKNDIFCVNDFGLQCSTMDACLRSVCLCELSFFYS